MLKTVSSVFKICWTNRVTIDHLFNLKLIYWGFGVLGFGGFGVLGDPLAKTV